MPKPTGPNGPREMHRTEENRTCCMLQHERASEAGSRRPKRQHRCGKRDKGSENQKEDDHVWPSRKRRSARHDKKTYKRTAKDWRTILHERVFGEAEIVLVCKGESTEATPDQRLHLNRQLTFLRAQRIGRLIQLLQPLGGLRLLPFLPTVLLQLCLAPALHGSASTHRQVPQKISSSRVSAKKSLVGFMLHAPPFIRYDNSPVLLRSAAREAEKRHQTILPHLHCAVELPVTTQQILVKMRSRVICTTAERESQRKNAINMKSNIICSTRLLYAECASRPPRQMHTYWKGRQRT